MTQKANTMDIDVYTECGQYAPLIRRHIAADFATLAKGLSKADITEVLTEILLGTKQTRFGPRPSYESIVSIREVLCDAVSRGLPIPFMVPWGSEKPDGSGPDVAEVGALKSLQALDAEIRKVWEPGTQMAIRLEDASAPFLFRDRWNEAWEQAKAYTFTFQQLVKVLGVNNVIVRPESELVTPESFAEQAEQATPAFLRAITTSDNSLLDAIGWKGGLSNETIQHYMRAYSLMSPGTDVLTHQETLARYFASALARHKLGVRGDLPQWEGQFIDLSFVPITPGTEHVFGRRIIRRTLPLSETQIHIPAWRAKGYVQIENDNSTRTRLTSFRDIPEDLISNTIILSNPTNGSSVTVNADYRVA